MNETVHWVPYEADSGRVGGSHRGLRSGFVGDYVGPLVGVWLEFKTSPDAGRTRNTEHRQQCCEALSVFHDQGKEQIETESLRRIEMMEVRM